MGDVVYSDAQIDLGWFMRESRRFSRLDSYLSIDYIRSKHHVFKDIMLDGKNVVYTFESVLVEF